MTIDPNEEAAASAAIRALLRRRNECNVCRQQMTDGACLNEDCCGNEPGPQASFYCRECERHFDAQHSGAISHGVTCDVCGSIPWMVRLL
jgi:hypothetical protein